MTSFAIMTEDEEDLGFILFASHEGDWPPPGPNDCVFNGFPYDPSLLETPEARFVADHKGREWSADFTYTDEEMTVLIDMDTGWTFELKSNAGGNSWTARKGEETLSGTGQFL
ncbi:hypothetical protein [Neorhizobium alkalisoli]|nr:hypothetical protein [Neorhizobium alkalisoli]